MKSIEEQNEIMKQFIRDIVPEQCAEEPDGTSILDRAEELGIIIAQGENENGDLLLNFAEWMEPCP